MNPFESELYLDDRRFYDTKERFENNSTGSQLELEKFYFLECNEDFILSLLLILKQLRTYIFIS